MTDSTGIEDDPSAELPDWIASAHEEIHLVWPCASTPASGSAAPGASGGEGPATVASAPEFVGQPVTAIATALERGVAVVYVVSSTVDCEPATARTLGELVGRYSETFDLFLARQGGLTHAPTTLVIDPNRGTDTLVVVAVAAGESTQAGGSSHLGPCVVVRGDAAFATSVVQHVTALTESESTVHLDSAERVAEMLGDRIHYFAYGSNMSVRQLKQRAPGAEPIGVGFLPDHELAFNRSGTYRPGGVAGPAFKRRARTYGVIYSITAQDLAELDRFENPDAYRRVTRTIVGTDGIRHRCQVYESIPEGEVAPDPEYLEALIAGAREAGLPPRYVERLESHRG